MTTEDTNAQKIAELLGVEGVVVLTSQPDGATGFLGYGVNHSRANEMLSIGIYCNLDQHYAAIRNGVIGKEAATHQKLIDQSNRAGVSK